MGEKPIPLHALTDDPSRGDVRRRRGRPRLAKPAPTFDEREYIQHANAACDLAVDSDALVQALHRRADPGDVLQEVRLKISREAAGLEFDARRQREGGRDPTVTLGRAIDALGKLAALEFARRKMGIDICDPRGPRVQQVVAMMLETIESACLGVLTAEETLKVMGAFRISLEGWEDAVRG